MWDDLGHNGTNGENGRKSAPFDAMRRAVEQVFAVDDVTFLGKTDDITVRFRGRLLADSVEAYERLDADFKPFGYTPIFREEEGDQVILAIARRFDAKTLPVWPNLIMLVLTVLSVMYVGAGIALGEGPVYENQQIAEIWRGIPYAAALMLILGAHELAHYFAARRHGLNATLPYFIPMPIGFFGTLGAFISLREPMKNRRAMLDVGVSGPLAGFIVAVPVLLIGLSQAEIAPLPTFGAYAVEGNSILYAVSKFLVFGRWLPGGGYDVWLNQLTQAGWTGLFVTALNLIPVGQLDGGHVLHTLAGDAARKLYWPIMIGLGALTLLVSESWALWFLLLLLFGRSHPEPLDAITKVDRQRKIIGLIVLIIFILVFTPNPLQIVQVGPPPPTPNGPNWPSI